MSYEGIPKPYRLRIPGILVPSMGLHHATAIDGWHDEAGQCSLLAYLPAWVVTLPLAAGLGWLLWRLLS